MQHIWAESGAFSREQYKLTQNLQISQGICISSFYNISRPNFAITIFNMLFLAVVMDFVLLAYIDQNLVYSWNCPF
jgi:hypothetical protein